MAKTKRFSADLDEARFKKLQINLAMAGINNKQLMIIVVDKIKEIVK